MKYNENAIGWMFLLIVLLLFVPIKNIVYVNSITGTKKQKTFVCGIMVGEKIIQKSPLESICSDKILRYSESRWVQTHRISRYGIIIFEQAKGKEVEASRVFFLSDEEILELAGLLENWNFEDSSNDAELMIRKYIIEMNIPSQNQ